MSTLLWIVVPLAVVSGMYWLSTRIEPHWVSKDGRRFLCNVQPISAHGAAEGRRRETRVIVRPDGLLQLDRRRPMRRRITEVWRVAGKSPDPPAKRTIYVLDPRRDDGGVGQLAVWLPSSSRAVPVLEELLRRQR